MEGLRDIKDIVEVHDHSLLILLSTIMITVLLLLLAFYLLRRRRRKRRHRPTPIELAKEALQQLDYDDAKSAAYTFGEHAEHFITEDNHALHQRIMEALMPYKYKKEVPPLDNETAKAMKDYIKGIIWGR